MPASPVWKQVEPFPDADGRGTRRTVHHPAARGPVGLLCTAGLLNRVFGQGSERHIARWRRVKSVTVFEGKEKGFKEIHNRERFSNELALVYEDGRTLVLGEEKIGKRIRMQNAHRRLGPLEYLRNMGEARKSGLLAFRKKNGRSCGPAVR
jgi:hypothetical protein